MVQYDIGTSQPDESGVSERVISAVADAQGTSPLELPPLYSVINPDALDTLFSPGTAGGKTGPGRVIFMFDDCEVMVHSDGDVDVTALGDQASASATAESVEDEDEAETALN